MMKNVPHSAKMCTTTSKKVSKIEVFLTPFCGTFLCLVGQSYNTNSILPNAKMSQGNFV